MKIKICGITKPDQAETIAGLGIDALGFICVPQSKRYVSPDLLRSISENLPQTIHRIGVFVDRAIEEMLEIYRICNLTGVQLHGQEPPEICAHIKETYPHLFLIKALAVRDQTTLDRASAYANQVDVLLLDTYDPQQAGGTGKTINWQLLKNFRPPCPWWLAGGLKPSNVITAITTAQPDGIDVSSGVERSAGDKNLAKVKDLIQQVRT